MRRRAASFAHKYACRGSASGFQGASAEVAVEAGGAA